MYTRRAPQVTALLFLLPLLIAIVVVDAIAVVIVIVASIPAIIMTIIIQTVAARSAGLARWRESLQAAGCYILF